MDAPDTQEKKEESGIGPMAATVIIVLLVAAAGIYFLLQQAHRLHTQPAEQILNT